MEDRSSKETRRVSGAVLHRRETNWQIYLPFLLGIVLLSLIFLIVAVPSDPVWRDRAQAIGDFLYTLLCIIPILVCLLPFYVMVLLGVYGMSKLHDGTERPLRKLENLTESLAKRIETVTTYVNDKTQTFGDIYQPIGETLSVFDSPPAEEENSDVTT